MATSAVVSRGGDICNVWQQFLNLIFFLFLISVVCGCTLTVVFCQNITSDQAAELSGIPVCNFIQFGQSVHHVLYELSIYFFMCNYLLYHYALKLACRVILSEGQRSEVFEFLLWYVLGSRPAKLDVHVHRCGDSDFFMSQLI